MKTLKHRDFKIFGLSLEDTQDFANEVLDVPPDKVSRYTDRVEAWAWERRADDPIRAPLYINWLDGKVSQIAGREFSVRGFDFSRSSSLADIRNVVPECDFLEIGPPGLILRRPTYTFSVLIVPNRNQFTLLFTKLEQERNNIMCERLDEREFEGYQKFTIRVNNEQQS